MPCLRCGVPVIRKLRGQPVKYCADCKKARKTETDRDRRHAVKADRDLLHSVAENLRGLVTDDMWHTMQEYISSTGAETGDIAFVIDRPPSGTKTHGGPNEGISTSSAELAQIIEANRMRASNHPWFEDHPHWLEGVNG